MPESIINKFIDNEDSVYNYKSKDIQEKRTEVDVKDEVPASYNTHRYSYSRHSNNNSDFRRRKRKSHKKSHVNKSVTIKEGQTLSEIAEKHHTTVKKLRKLNGISGTNIRSGKKIKVK